MKAVFALKHKPSSVNLKRHLLLSLFAFLLSGYAFAADVTLAWDHSTSSSSVDFGGYNVYYREAANTYTLPPVDAGKATTLKVTGLTAGKTYFFAVKSYNAAKTIESSTFSNEASKAIPLPPVTLTADFTSAPSNTSGVVPGSSIIFTPTTTGAITSWIWKLTDPSGIVTTTTKQTASTLPVSFPSVGTYSLVLTVSDSTGSSTATSAARSITVTAPPPPPPPPPVVSPAACSTIGLVAAYGFEETSGTTARDTSGHGNVGTIREAVRIKGGRYGRALRFDGVNDFVTVKDSASLDLLAAYSIEAWVKPRALTRSSILVKELHPAGGVPGGTVYDLYAYGDGDLYDSTFNDGSYRTISGGSLPINTWSHLVATYDGKTQSLYLNGRLVKTNVPSQSGQIKQSANPLRIGGNAIWGEYFKGTIDEVRLYNCGLTATEISTDLAKPVGK